MNHKMKHDRGVLSFEWILLISLMVIGAIGGIGVLMGSLNGELVDTAEVITSAEQQYHVTNIHGRVSYNSQESRQYLGMGGRVYTKSSKTVKKIESENTGSSNLDTESGSANPVVFMDVIIPEDGDNT